MFQLKIDDRQLDDRIKKVQAAFPESKVVRLLSADFTWISALGQSIGIELKTITDLLNSVRNYTLADELRRVTTSYDEGLLLIVGNYKEQPNGKIMSFGYHEEMPFAYVDNCLLSIQRQLNISVVQCSSEATLPHRLKTIIEYYDDNHEYCKRIKRADVPFILLDQDFNRAIAAVMCLGRLGQNTAIQLLRNYKSLKRVFNLTEKELLAEEGIGKKRAKDIEDYIAREFDVPKDI